MGERYKTIAKETAGVLRGSYGASPAPVNKTLQARVLDGDEPVTCRPADLLEPEMDTLTAELEKIANERKLKLADAVVDDVLIYALFPQVGLKFLANRDNPDAFEKPPWEIEDKPTAVPAAAPAAAPIGGPEAYRVEVNGKAYDVTVSPQGAVETVTPAAATATAAAAAGAPSGPATAVEAPMAGNIVRIAVNPGQQVEAGEVVVVLEAMKMETDVRAPVAGAVGEIKVKEGDAVALGATLLTLG
jgi:oxaloacetate decarboxylase alpha subunit